jgi:hypothetical protein
MRKELFCSHSSHCNFLSHQEVIGIQVSRSINNKANRILNVEYIYIFLDMINETFDNEIINGC